MTTQNLCPAAPLEEQLKAFFGYNEFRHNQKDIISAILARKDVLAILPTGAGKSICYQLPAMLLPGIAVVVSPLISLMQDQVVSLTKNGIPAAFLNSSLHPQDARMLLNSLVDYKLLYVAPERFADPNFIQSLQNVSVSFFAIDEAHCISQWGHSFRPEYRQLAALKTTFPTSSMVALTATATKEVEQDISSQLAMQSPYTVRASFDRPNLTFLINAKADIELQLQNFISKHEHESGIIYASTRKTVDQVFASLQQQGFKVGKYHAGMNDSERTKAQHDFVYGQLNLMVATVAFGMGIHKPDIRYIVHHDMPRTIEQYYQEIGRAGRDGLPAECLMLYSAQDLMIYNSFLKDVDDQALRKITKAKTDKMYALCRSLSCRRKELLHYFSEEYPSTNCNGCDNCLDNTEVVDEIIVAQKILSCVARVEQRFGAKYVIDVLRGSRGKVILERQHDQLSTHGLMREYSEGDLHYYVDALIDLGYLKKTEGDYPILQWTDSSKDVIGAKVKVMLRKKTRQMVHKKDSQGLEYDRGLFNELVALRLKWAQDTQVPAFVVFGDRTLIEMATSYPATREAMLTVNGVGPTKWERYGQSFMDVIANYCTRNGIDPIRLPQPVKAPLARAVLKPDGQARLASSKQTVDLYLQGHGIAEIAGLRDLTSHTIVDHLVEQIQLGRNLDVTPLVSLEKQAAIKQVIAKVGAEKLTPIKQALSEDFTFEEIRLVVAFFRREHC